MHPRPVLSIAGTDHVLKSNVLGADPLTTLRGKAVAQFSHKNANNNRPNRSNSNKFCQDNDQVTRATDFSETKELNLNFFFFFLNQF